VLFCSLKKGLTLKIRMLCFVTINSALFPLMYLDINASTNTNTQYSGPKPLSIQPQNTSAPDFYQYSHWMQQLKASINTATCCSGSIPQCGLMPQDAMPHCIYWYNHRMQRLRTSINTTTGCSGSGPLLIQPQDAVAQCLYWYSHRLSDRSRFF